MKGQAFKSVAALSLAFVAGIAVANLPRALASSDSASTPVTEKKFFVAIDEVRQSFVFFKPFSGSFKHTATMSDGSRRTVELRPTVHDGMQVVELNDSGHISYMSQNGRTTNGSLMIEVRDADEWNRQLREQGWRLPSQ